MGTLRKYKLNTSGCDIFFETGTGLGHSLKHALENGNFNELYSTEIHEETAKKAQKLFQNYSKNIPKVNVLNTNSIDGLNQVLPTINKNQKILFYLDAHFPGEVSSNYSYEGNIPNNLTMPLKEELELIKKLRPNSGDIIIVDDLRLYEDGPYESGNIVASYANIQQDMRDLSFLESLYSDRSIERDYKDEGYLLIKPKDSLFRLKKLSQIYRLRRSLRKNFNRLFNKQ
jgi:hypothetical protein